MVIETASTFNNGGNEGSENLRDNVAGNSIHGARADERYDVIFVVEGRDFCAHRIVVAEASPTIKELLTNSIERSNVQGSSYIQRITLTAITDRAFENMIHFMYSQELSVSLEEAIELLKVSDKYQVNGLVAALDRFLSSKINGQSYIQLSYVTTNFDLPVLSVALAYRLVKNFDVLKGTGEYIQLSHKTVLAICRSGEFQIKNGAPFKLEFVVKWLTKQGNEERLVYCNELINGMIRKSSILLEGC